MQVRCLFIFLMLTLISTTGWAQAAESELLPDLNLLQKRVIELWSLVTQDQKLKALSYVEPGRQELFLKYNWRPLKGFALREIRLSNQPGEAFVTVRAKAVSASFTGGLEWPVEQTWIFRDGTWFFRAEESRVKELFRGQSSPGPAASSSKERKRIERKLRQFRIAASRIQFGQVDQGETQWREIDYQNSSQIPVAVRVDKAPPWVGFDSSHFRVNPGEKGKLLLGVFSQALEGEIVGSVSLILTHRGVEVKREFKVVGSVTPAISVVPRHLIVGPNSLHAILIQNNTDQPVEISRIRSSDSFIVAEPAAGESDIVGPRARATLEVTWTESKVPEDWTAGWIELMLSEPVGGHASFRIPVVRKFP